MTIRQKIIKIIYPFLLAVTKWAGKNGQVLRNRKGVKPPVSFYSLSAVLNNGAELPFSSLKGKKVILVNTASDCGYTPQYNELQELYVQEKEKLEIIGFPANDFKQQEQKTDEEIARFCQLNFGVEFPLARKSVVVSSAAQNPVFSWLSNASLNGWNSKAPVWNFSKYLIDEEGRLQAFFGPSIRPASREIQSALHHSQ